MKSGSVEQEKFSWSLWAELLYVPSGAGTTSGCLSEPVISPAFSEQVLPACVCILSSRMGAYRINNLDVLKWCRCSSGVVHEMIRGEE